MKEFRYSITAIAAATLMLAACGGSDNSSPSGVVSTPSTFDVTQIDKSVSACDDFDAHVNRKWAAATQIPDGESSVQQFSLLKTQSNAVQLDIAQHGGPDEYSKVIADFYRVALDEAAPERAGAAPLAGQFAKIDAIKDTASLAAYLTASAADGRATLFQAGPSPGFEDSSRNIAAVRPGKLSLSSRDAYLDPAESKKRDDFVHSVARAFELTGMTASAAATAARQVLEFETKLANASPTEEELNDPPGIEGMISIAEANRLTPHLDWNAYFRAQGVTPPVSFSMPFRDFYSEVDEMIGTVPLDQWKAALRYSVIKSASTYLPKAFRESGDMAGLSRPQLILNEFSDGVLSQVMGAAYARKAFSPTTAAAAEALVNELRVAFRARLQKSDWLSPETVKRALEKEQAMTFKIGAPKNGPDISQLKLPGSSFYDNAMAVLRFEHQRAMSQIGKATDREEWPTAPQTVNATYSAQDNSVVITTAILQPPFFDPKADPALNYGGIGAVIAHEITHGFDTSGSKYDAQGNETNWWQDSDKARFKERVDKLDRQFAAYEVLPGLRVNSTLTEAENIADLGGMNTAFDALNARLAREGAADQMIDGYTQQQRFYLAWARNWRNKATEEDIRENIVTDSHAPEKFRANGSVSNTPSFAAAFACKPGSPMARTQEDRVTIW
jgi:putative endopeptidase